MTTFHRAYLKKLTSEHSIKEDVRMKVKELAKDLKAAGKEVNPPPGYGVSRRDLKRAGRNGAGTT